jgi:23S rRNA (guanosine2251-2'-O)-methyltransferase
MDQNRMVYGLHAVRALMARNPGRVAKLWLLADRSDRKILELLALAERHRIAIGEATPTRLDELSRGAVHQGVLAEVRMSQDLAEVDLPSLIQSIEGTPLVLVLDGVQDPHNLGACLRSADAFGAHAVIIPRDRAAPVTPVVRKVAAGAAETIPVVTVVNLARSLGELQELGLWVVGADADAQGAAETAALDGPLALVLGSEGEGMRRLTRDTCDLLVKLPLSGSVESLNVAVAAGILLYEVGRQRRQKKTPSL